MNQKGEIRTEEVFESCKAAISLNPGLRLERTLACGVVFSTEGTLICAFAAPLHVGEKRTDTRVKDGLYNTK